jgi:hypothetical protein
MTDGDGPRENEPPPAAPSGFIAAAIVFWRRVRERKVAQWGAGYIVAAFGLMQGLLLIAETFDWPAAAGRMAFAVFATGFPIVLIIAWSHGDRGRQRVTRTETGLIAACVAVGAALIVLAAQAPTTNSGSNRRSQDDVNAVAREVLSQLLTNASADPTLPDSAYATVLALEQSGAPADQAAISFLRAGEIARAVATLEQFAADLERRGGLRARRQHSAIPRRTALFARRPPLL